jgi:hypothetical protein
MMISVDPALRTGIPAEVAVLRNLLNTSPSKVRATHLESSQ